MTTAVPSQINPTSRVCGQHFNSCGVCDFETDAADKLDGLTSALPGSDESSVPPGLG